MSKNVLYSIKPNGSIVLYIDSECEVVASDHPNYNKILDAIKTKDFSNITTLVNVAKAVTSFAKGQISIVNGQIFYGAFALHNTLTTRILKMMNEGFKFDHMVAFLNNLMQNPSNRAVNETYTFLENYGLPITDDGCFLAYKAVRNDYKDIYSGKLDNSVGKTVSMPRNMVDEVYERDCSTGLHVGALDYVVQYGHFTKGAAVGLDGNRLLIVKVNPKDVVSVPRYENHPKMRVSEYLVVNEIKDIVKELDKVVYTAKAETLEPDFDDEDGEDGEDGELDTLNPCGEKPLGESTPFNKSKVDTTSPWNEAKYRKGWADGGYDYDNENEYGTSRDYSEENSYRMGYNDAYNGRANKADEEQVSGGECDCHSCSCDIDDSSSVGADSDYNRGYLHGVDEAESNNELGATLADDESDEYKDGYEDGYYAAKND